MSRDDVPNGPISGAMHEISLQVCAVRRHAHAEGHDFPLRPAAELHDRAHHPIMRQWRPHAIRERIRGWW